MGRPDITNLAWAYCKTCNEYKAMSPMQRSGGGKYYYRKWCTQCYTEMKSPYRKEYQAKNAEYLNRYHAIKYQRTKASGKLARKRYYDKWKKQVFDHYGYQCVCCGEDEHRFLTIDHMNDNGAQQRELVGAGYVFFKWLVANNYPNDYRVLCHNCNTGRFRNGGKCPHETRKYLPSNWIV